MFSPVERERYARQLALPGFGEEGQRRLRETSVLLIGAGGLGSPLSLYLAAAGVGRVGLIDGDRVERSNLQRQILYREKDIGCDKTERAQHRLRALNPDIDIEVHAGLLSATNALSLFERFDIVADGSDNFPTRYLANDAAVLTGRPLVYGSVFRFSGQASVFHFDGGPCYRCLFPEPPPAGAVPDCAEGGVLGVLPGIIGSIQALEVMKIASGVGEPLAGRLMIFDGMSGSTRYLSVLRDPTCPVCGTSPTIRELVDYEAFCGATSEAVPSVDARTLARWMDERDDVFLLDVREPFERGIASIGGTLIPLGSLDERVEEVPLDRDVVAICRSGKRSAEAIRLLRRHGHDRAWNLEGGLQRWRQVVDSSMAEY
ncbi:MAG: molybdopterin-synthase adenylyltransferase MoeB [Rhodothermales bacterium]